MIGHCFCIIFRRVNKAAHDQIEKLWHTTNIYFHSPIHEYAQRLTEKLPENLKVRLIDLVLLSSGFD